MIWIWVFEIDRCLGGDVPTIVAWAKAHHVGLIVKTHDGATTIPNGIRAPLLIQACQAAGVPVRAWGYVYPFVAPELQAEFALAEGIDYIADDEVEWDGHADDAKAFVDALLARRRPGQLLGSAPLPIRSYHDGAGQYEQFDRLDLACPQAYAGTGGRDAIGALQWTEQEWAAAAARGARIEPAVYAADQPADGLRSALAIVIGKARQFGDGDVSIWSLQHLSAAHVAVIDEFAQEDDMLSPTQQAILDKLAKRPDLVDILVDHADTFEYLIVGDGTDARSPKGYPLGAYGHTVERVEDLEDRTKPGAVTTTPLPIAAPATPAPVRPIVDVGGNRIES